LRELRFKRRTPSRDSIEEIRREREERGTAVALAAALKFFARATAMNRAMSPRRSITRRYHRPQAAFFPGIGKHVSTFSL
jgi:hypothetical protein